jgi:transposase
MKGVFMAIKRKKIIELLKEGFSQSEVALALRCSKRDVSKMAKFLKDNDIDDEALAKLTEDDLRQITSTKTTCADIYVAPDLDYICRELKKRGVSRKLLWYEYCSTTLPKDMQMYQYSQFCKLIEKHLAKTGATMRIKHIAGKCMYVDWAGDTMFLRDRITGVDIKVYVFVACLPYSGYCYAQGFLDTTQRSWISAHESSFGYFGGTSSIIVPDQCATATKRSPIYTTVINATYLEFIEHHNCATVPARKYKPKDKAAVEGAVGIIEKWIIAALRKETFFDLGDLNEAIWQKLDWINERPFAAKDGCRLSVFETQEKQYLKPANPNPFEQYFWKRCVVSHDYHVQIDYMRYSVDYHLIKEVLDARIADKTIDLFFKGQIVASHTRLYGRKGQFSTNEFHMPKNHKNFDSSWSPDTFVKWARRIGPATEAAIVALLASRKIVEQAYVSCSNILNLAKRGRSDSLEQACEKFVDAGICVSYTQVKNTMEAIRATNQSTAQDVYLKKTEVQGSDIGRTRGSSYYARSK